MEENGKQVIVGYYTAPDGQVIPLMADAKYYPNGVPDIPLQAIRSSMPQTQPVYAGIPQTPQTQPGYAGIPQTPKTQPGYVGAPQMQPGYSVAPQMQQRYVSAPPSLQKQKRNLESVVGKNLMGILASVLIFIGLILFATVAYEKFSNVARIVSVYLLSSIILAVGLIGMHKNRNAFFLSLAGCGVGAIYISMFLSYGYFHLINEIMLYILLAVWSFIVFFLGGRGSFLFKIIGQSGILISSVYGVVMQLMSQRSDMLLTFALVLIGYYIVTTVFYLLMDWKKGLKENLPILIIDYIGALNLLLLAFYIRKDVQPWVMLILVAVLLCYMAFLLYIFQKRIDLIHTLSDASIGWAFCVLFETVYAAFSIKGLLPAGEGNSWIQGCFAFVNYGLIWLMTERRGRKDEGRLVSLLILYTFFWIYSGSFGMLSDLLGIGFLALLFLIAGYFKKDRIYFCLGCLSSGIYILFMGKYPAVYSLFSMLFILLIFFFLLYGSNIYHSGFKIAAYCFLQIFILRLSGILPLYTIISRNIWINYAYFASVVLCIAATHSLFCRDWIKTENRENSTQLALGVLNVLLMLWGISVLNLKNAEIFHALTLLFFIACCTHNIIPMIKGYDKSLGAGIYIGIKLTLCLFFSLFSYDIESYLITVSCFALALAFILLGFLRMYKPIRLYGLVLSLYCIFKLVLFDVKYDSTLSRALTIMGCGILAFAISFIYNRISKKMDVQEEVKKKDDE